MRLLRKRYRSLADRKRRVSIGDDPHLSDRWRAHGARSATGMNRSGCCESSIGTAPTLDAVVATYNAGNVPGLNAADRSDRVEYLKSL